MLSGDKRKQRLDVWTRIKTPELNGYLGVIYLNKSAHDLSQPKLDDQKIEAIPPDAIITVTVVLWSTIQSSHLPLWWAVNCFCPWDSQSNQHAAYSSTKKCAGEWFVTHVVITGNCGSFSHLEHPSLECKLLQVLGRNFQWNPVHWAHSMTVIQPKIECNTQARSSPLPIRNISLIYSSVPGAPFLLSPGFPSVASGYKGC